VNDLPHVLDTLRRLDKGIDELETLRSGLTNRLEQLATLWNQRYPQPMMTPGHQHRLACSRCCFRYLGTTETEVRFGTDCTYCDRDAGIGVEIPVAWFERQLHDEEVS